MVAGPKLRCAGRRGGPLRLSRRGRLRRLSAGGFGRADHGRTEEGRSEHDQRGICGQARYAFEPCESRYLAGAGGRRPSAREGAVCAWPLGRSHLGWHRNALAMPAGEYLHYNALTVDTFPSWTALGQGAPANTAWPKVHPDMPFADYLSLVGNTRSE